MLYIHKASRGVLQTTTRPAEYSSGDWWTVRENTYVGRKILRYYPCFDAVCNGKGELLDITPWGEHRIKRVDRGGPADPKRDWRYRHDPKSRFYRRKGT